MNTQLTDSEMQQAYLERDTSYNGLFVFGVRTTGIFCRPTCPARRPLAKNVEFFANSRAALLAGYRPCKRCRPLAADDQPGWVSQLFSQLQQQPAGRLTDAELKAQGFDPATVRRYFRRHYGMTFQAFARARRLAGSLQRLQAGDSIDATVLASGYESHSGFRDAFARIFGSSPGKYRSGDCICVSWLSSPLGPMIAGATLSGICLLEFTDRRSLGVQLTSLEKHFHAPLVPGSNEHLERLENELAEYFQGGLRQFRVPVVSPGTAFQRRVWQELQNIPYGETRSYEQLARELGCPRGVRAVGRANGLNRIAIVIPCHRVIKKCGKLGGYAGGLRRKQYLLDLERQGAAHPAR